MTTTPTTQGEITVSENTYEAGQKVLITLNERYHDLVGLLYPSTEFEATYLQVAHLEGHVVYLGEDATDVEEHRYVLDSEVSAA